MTGMIQPVVRAVAPSEQKAERSSNKKIGTIHIQIQRVARTNTGKTQTIIIPNPNIQKPGIVVTEIVIDCTPKKSNVSKRRIRNGRNRKQALRDANPTMVADYDTSKNMNLKQLVKEYESERASSTNARERKNVLKELKAYGISKSNDAIAEQVVTENQIKQDLLKHYRNAFADLVQRYNIVDTEKRAEEMANEIYRDFPQTVVDTVYDIPNPTPRQLRIIVCSFNNQHR